MKRKMKINEIIIVEGKDDTRRIQEVVDADTIETIGSAINQEILTRISHAQEKRGVIVFTDPDYSGEKIRKIIMEIVPNAKHAFLPRKLARPKKPGKSLGVEHASDAAIIDALKRVVTPIYEKDDYQEITKQELINYQLITGKGAKKRRECLGEILVIGYTNGKQLEKRLKMFRITSAELKEAMQKVEEFY